MDNTDGSRAEKQRELFQIIAVEAKLEAIRLAAADVVSGAPTKRFY